MAEKYLTTRELCDKLVLTRMTIERYRKEGMPFIKDGTLVKFDYKAVLAWLKENNKKAASYAKK